MIPADVVIRIAGLLVPRERRRDWTREWLAELHYAQRHAGEAESLAFARGAFYDAAWQQRDFWTPKRTARLMQSPWFCLGATGAGLVLITILSGLLPATRRALLPLPYRDAGQVVTIAQSATLATRTGVPGEDVALWRARSRTLGGVATYRWNRGEKIADVSDNFFAVLGTRGSFGKCLTGACVVLSDSYARAAGNPSALLLDGKRYTVTGVAARGFWFVSPKIAVWRMEPWSKTARTGVVARLRGDSSIGEATAELGAILRDAGQDDWESFMEISPVDSRVHLVFWMFGFVAILSVLIILPVVRLRVPKWNPPAAGFFAAKIALLLTAVLLVGIEFTGASSITMLGGADETTAVSAWLFMMGSTGALAWSIADQRQRCRVCLKRLGLAAHVGCTGCLLLDWAGTELVCLEGHGMLHVPEMVACWQEPDKWTLLDETWQELFVERGLR